MSKAPSPEKDLREYKSWRKTIVPLEIGTVVRFNVEYAPLTWKENILPGQHFKIMTLERGVVPRDSLAASKTYELQLCTESGNLYDHKAYWSVEALAAFLLDGNANIVK